MLYSLASFGQNYADLYEKIAPSVVTIYTNETMNAGVGDPHVETSASGMGTGFLVDEDGYVVTAAHVVANAEEIVVEFYDDQQIEAHIISISRIADVALIKLLTPPDKPVVAKLGNSDAMRIGEPIVIVGAPLGLKHSLSTGIISGRHKDIMLNQEGRYMEFFQTDASINKGNSGGPMFNTKGEVIGIVSSILSFSGGFEGLGFAATINVAKNLLKRSGNRYFGIDGIYLNYEFARILNVPQESGILVQTVVKNSPAFFTGLKGGYVSSSIAENEVLLGGDIILGVDNINLTSPEKYAELQDYFDSIKEEEILKIKILRDGQIMTLSWFRPDYNDKITQ